MWYNQSNIRLADTTTGFTWAEQVIVGWDTVQVTFHSSIDMQYILLITMNKTTTAYRAQLFFLHNTVLYFLCFIVMYIYVGPIFDFYT